MDPLQGVYNLRVYREDVEVECPLSQEMRAYDFIATLVISGHVATVSAATSGDAMLGDDDLWQEFHLKMHSLGVSEVHWERRKNGRVKIIKQKVKVPNGNTDSTI